MSFASDRAPVTIVVPLPPSYRGGTEEYAYRLTQRFSRTRPVQVLTTTVRWEPNAPVLDTGTAWVERLPAREVFERPLLIAPAVRRRLRDEIASSGVLQLHMPFPLVERLAVQTAQRAGIPSVLTYHMDADLGGARPFRGSGAITRCYRALSAHPSLAACDAIVSNSRGYAEASPVLRHHLSKVRVIRKGVDVHRLGLGRRSVKTRARPAIVAPEAFPPGRDRLLFLGRLVPYKGLPVLLEAVQRLRDAGRDVGLMIAGTGPMESALGARAAELRIAPFVSFLGFVPDTEVGPLYRFADVVAAPSISTLESTATSLEEAAMCGTAVVGTELPGAGETVPHDGVRGRLVPPGRADCLAEAIAKMLDAGRPPEPLPLRTWDDTAREYVDLFRELGAGFPSRSGRRRPTALRRPAVPGFSTLGRLLLR
ncbi:MAG: glycosyltransferase [Thermoplasmata archaeon]|nr:glycosyltransferase [Thermoplasmata archaeon]